MPFPSRVVFLVAGFAEFVEEAPDAVGSALVSFGFAGPAAFEGVDGELLLGGEPGTEPGRVVGGRRVYCGDDVEWLTVCIVLRASGMPLPSIRRYAELVREGPGNEAERLTLMRQHKDRVNTQIQKLTRCLDLINFKVGVYEDIVEQITDGHPAATDRQSGLADQLRCVEDFG